MLIVMSRGLGKLQRRLLKMLHEHEHAAGSLAALAAGLDTVTLAARAYWGTPGWTPEVRELVATRRALSGLMRQRLVVRLGASRNTRRCHWRLNPPKPQPAHRRP
jgi:hypothetical protein